MLPVTGRRYLHEFTVKTTSDPCHTVERRKVHLWIYPQPERAAQYQHLWSDTAEGSDRSATFPLSDTVYEQTNHKSELSSNARGIY